MLVLAHALRIVSKKSNGDFEKRAPKQANAIITLFQRRCSMKELESSQLIGFLGFLALPAVVTQNGVLLSS